MPTPAVAIGPVYDIYVPQVDTLIDLGYTHIRVYWATSETATPSLATSIELVAGTYDYAYNKTDGLETDWAEHCFYGTTPGEGPRSERVPVGPGRITRKDVRQGVGRRLRIMDGPYTIGTVTDADTIIVTELIDPDASVHRFANRFIRVVTGTGIGQTRRVRASSSTPAGYVPATGTLNVNRATDPAWVAGDTFECWRAKDDEDPSVLIDEAMQRVADRICVPDSFLFTIDSNVTEYYLPAGMTELTIQSVKWAGDTYPAKPQWEDVGWWRVYHEGGQAVLSLLRNSLGREFYTQGDIIQVNYAYFPDRMDSDADYWRGIPLQWAIAETALELLDALATPSGGEEQVQDAARAKGALQREISAFRARFQPVPRMKVAVAT